MEIVHTVDALRQWRSGAGRLAFVPTMGNLHAGHLSLARIARSHASRVAASIFVNRLQFAPHEDFESYPRTFDADCRKLADEGVDLVFAPDERVLYPEAQQYVVRPSSVADDLEGRFRPGFFNGVATVVLKLFNCVQPDIAVFGKKDYQQLLVVRGMVRQFNLPVEIVAGETVRESDGLALSSRNGYLSAAERAEAPRLHRSLRAVQARIAGGRRDYRTLGEEAMRELAQAGWNPDYVEVRRCADLAPAQHTDTDLVILAAARLGTTRLIDNIETAST